MTDFVGVNRPLQYLCDRRQGKLLTRSAEKMGLKVKVISKNLGKEIKIESRTVDHLLTPKRSRKGILRKRKRKNNRNRKNKDNKTKESSKVNDDEPENTNKIPT